MSSAEGATAVGDKPAAVGPRVSRRQGRRIRHPWAIVGFLAPFAVLFTAFYLVPIGYAVVESLYTVTRVGGTSSESAGLA